MQPNSPTSRFCRGLTAQWERAWQGQAIPDLGAFLHGLPDAARADVVAVCCLDQCRHWERGSRRLTETYLVLRPELRDDSEAVLDLLGNEYAARRGAGERPEVEEFIRRFPTLAEALRRLDVDNLIGRGEPSRSDTVVGRIPPPPAAQAR